MLALRVVVSLGVVVGLMVVAGRVLAHRGTGMPRRGGTSGSLDVVAQRSLNRQSAVAIVQVADRRLVVGVSPNAINLLADLPAEPAPAPEPARSSFRPRALHAPSPRTRDTGSGGTSPGTSARRTLLDEIRERTVRHV